MNVGTDWKSGLENMGKSLRISYISFHICESNPTNDLVNSVFVEYGHFQRATGWDLWAL